MRDAAELSSIVGEEHVREGEAVDAVDGAIPRIVVRPATVEEVSEILSVANAARWRVVPRGGGTKLGLGNPLDRVDLLLALDRLDRVLEHAAGDLVVAVEAGVRLESLQAGLALSGQMLALDPGYPGATVGGTISANASGPRRFRYGTARDLLIGVTLVLADGTIAKSGGKVVKNVAGYDLAKLVTGALGTLGVIVRAVFRLHPRPRTQRLVEVDLSSLEQVSLAADRLLRSTLEPSAIQLLGTHSGGLRLGVLFEGMEPSVVAQAAAAADLLGPDATAQLHVEEEATRRWRELVFDPPDAGAVQLKVSHLPARTAETLHQVRSVADRVGVGWRVSAMVGSGLLDVRLEGAEPAIAAGAIRELRTTVRPGHVIVLAAPLEVKREIDVWGPTGDSIDLMRRVKDRFDPHHLLNPGRFVGGI